MPYLQVIIGLILLIFSGESLVKGSVSLAIKLKVSTLVIGMTIVSFGTSAPELLVSIKAALSGNPDIVVGAVIGSNISNIALILGLTAFVFPIAVSRDSLAIDWPMMMLATGLFYLLAGPVLTRETNIEWYEGFILFFSLFFFGAWLVRRSRKKIKLQEMDRDTPKSRSHALAYVKDLAFILAGCVGLVYGADIFLDGAKAVARLFEVSDRVIGLTLVAFGTSLPELITSLVAAFRRHSDISIGNLIGSNIFNLLAILGVTSMIKEIPVSEVLIKVDYLWMLGVSFLVFPMMIFKLKITRLEGAILVLFYLVYIRYVLIS